MDEQKRAALNKNFEEAADKFGFSAQEAKDLAKKCSDDVCSAIQQTYDLIDIPAERLAVLTTAMATAMRICILEYKGIGLSRDKLEIILLSTSKTCLDLEFEDKSNG